MDNPDTVIKRERESRPCIRVEDMKLRLFINVLKVTTVRQFDEAAS
jgi:hypothetical protein